MEREERNEDLRQRRSHSRRGLEAREDRPRKEERRRRRERKQRRNRSPSSSSRESQSRRDRRHRHHRSSGKRKTRDPSLESKPRSKSRERRQRKKRRRREQRDRSPSSRRSTSFSPSHRRNRRRRSPRRKHDRHSDRSSVSSESRRSPQRRRRRQRRSRRRGRHDSRGRSVSSSYRGHRGAHHGAPVAGIVSDDEDHKLHDTKRKKSPHEQKPAGGSPSSSHDDTIGHFKGREGTVIADRYRILQEVGVGTFGRVVECLDLRRSRRDRQEKIVAIKIVRDVKRYYESALIEADIVSEVNRRGGRGVTHCARMFDTFSFSGHYCMVFERLGPSLYDWLKAQKYRPFPIVCVRDFAKQLLETVEFLHSFRLIHTDLKPENILLLDHSEVNYRGHTVPRSTQIKVIDFGGATYDNEKKSSVVNTRQYRAPEVILGLGWSMPSDLWSVGCILAELYQGELLFATHDNVEHLALIQEVIGLFPHRTLKHAKNTQLLDQSFDSKGKHLMQRVLSPESFAYVRRTRPLESIVYKDDYWFLQLLRRLLVIDPDDRATARDCVKRF